MNPTVVEFGERYSDDSGWEKRLSVNTVADRIEIEAGGTHAIIKQDELWWIVCAALRAREHLGMDKLPLDGPEPTKPTSEHSK